MSMNVTAGGVNRERSELLGDKLFTYEFGR